MSVQTVPIEALSPADIAAWSAIQADVPGLSSPLFSPGFTKVVARHRPDTRVSVMRDAEGAAIAFLPHQRRPDGLGRPLGAPFGDYQAIVTRDLEQFDSAGFLSAAGFTAFAFTGLTHALGSGADTGMSSVDSYQIILSEKPGDYLESLRAASPKRYKNWRRLAHKTEREVGPISLRAPDRDPAILHQLLNWKAGQMVRTGVTNVLRPAWVRAMMDELLLTTDGDFSGLMITLWAGDSLMGGHFGVRLGGVYHPWMAAINPQHQALSPGQTYLLQAIGAMDDLGLHTYDLGTGHAHYKAPFCNRFPTVAEGRVIADPGRRSTAATGLTAKVAARLDHIASVELSLGGRVGGILAAMRHAGARLRHRGNDDAHEMGA